MGCSQSKELLTPDSGTEAEYKATFEETRVLGQGEFGLVKLCVNKADPAADPYAVKILSKGFVFKDNTLYAPMAPDTLKMEIDILRTLGGQKFNLFLDSVYESASKIYLVTEACAGGEMLEYTAKNMAKGLRTEDVSRIAFQLLSAVAHCDKHNILHRDIKPENIMFKANTKTAELRLIDFGCAIMDEESGKEHATFAGTPFYISPEVFQKKYTTKTDVFSVGVVLYVLVSGYPAENLQAAFNLLHKAKRDLKTLPGMPKDMPDMFFKMLDKMLNYFWKKRKSAKELLDDEFVVFHNALKSGSMRTSLVKTQSIVLSGTGEKAALAFGFAKFQRSLTAILAVLMDREDIKSLVAKAEAAEAKVSSGGDDKLDTKLGVVKVKDLKSILETMGKSDCVAAIDKQNNAHIYDNYSYEYILLKIFAEKPEHLQDEDDEGNEKPAVALSRSSRILSKNAGFSTRNMSNRLSASGHVNRKSRLSKTQSVAIRGI